MEMSFVVSFQFWVSDAMWLMIGVWMVARKCWRVGLNLVSDGAVDDATRTDLCRVLYRSITLFHAPWMLWNLSEESEKAFN